MTEPAKQSTGGQVTSADTKAAQAAAAETQDSDEVVMIHLDTDGVSIVTRKAFELAWSTRGWEEINADKPSAELKATAEKAGVRIFDKMTTKNIAEAIIAQQLNAQRER